MRQCMDADNLHRRLKKIIGQVQAIDRMIDEDIRSGSDQRGQVRPSRVRQGGAGGTHQPLCPGRNRARRCRADHCQLYQGCGAVRQHEMTTEIPGRSQAPSGDLFVFGPQILLTTYTPMGIIMGINKP